ncbi:hypothetical protein OK351_01670 [Glutamicibacter sp. MNS18]|uniref:hypothetical protein n=1 Tax=Glutamicibacter sp. MNS18 TaxID=2989817 RepID=UPI002236620F|nr:hypothetical protein [Glutamicibacter sp. MNS18]MCW4464218.1 hypothetical protein [Glutamicibacter sp. MNS18]
MEQRLIDHLVAGLRLDLDSAYTEHSGASGEEMLGWGAVREIRSEVIRSILRGQLVPVEGPDPCGLRVSGARIVGRLDLENMVVAIPLELAGCHIPEGINARECRIPRLALHGSTIGVSTAGRKSGALCLTGANIGSTLRLTGARLENEQGPALSADRLHVGGGMILNDGFTALGVGPSGAVRCQGASIGGQLNLRNAHLENSDGPALSGDRVTAEGGLRMNDGFKAFGTGDAGAVRLLGARIGGQLSLRDAHLANPDGPALSANGISIARDLFMDGTFAAVGRVGLVGASVKGRLVVSAKAARAATHRPSNNWEVDGLGYSGSPPMR